MKTPDPTKINQPWPSSELESVDACPYCGSHTRTLSYHGVQDWSFYGARGRWDYHECLQCQTIYLDPRPTEASIGQAYASYYTHQSADGAGDASFISRLKLACLSRRLKTNFEPRLHLPTFLSPLLNLVGVFISVPFGLEALSRLAPGRLLDVGCGAGDLMKLAREMGWQATGIEVDPDAVTFARARGLDVVQGGVQALGSWTERFDCINCSHVLEHVHEPLELLNTMTHLLKDDGTLLLSLPNARSHVRARYGRFWRGLEAPRHLAIPTLEALVSRLTQLGYQHIIQFDVYDVTMPESRRIRSGRMHVAVIDQIIFKSLKMVRFLRRPAHSDFIQIVARRG